MKINIIKNNPKKNILNININEKFTNQIPKINYIKFIFLYFIFIY